MSIINVQFGDATEAVIIGYFAAPQDPDVWANLGEVESSDPRWHTYYDSMPEWIQIWLPEPE